MPPIRRRIKFTPQSEPKEAELIDVTDSKESWNEYLLSDGTIIRMRPVATEVWRIIGEYDNDGNPVYIIKSSNATSVNAPDSLRRP